MTASKINYLAWAPGEHLVRNSGTGCELYHKLLTLKTMLFLTLKGISYAGVMWCFMDEEIVVSLQNIPHSDHSRRRLVRSTFDMSVRLELGQQLNAKLDF